MKLSVVIVNYNGEKYLKDCINSINENCKLIDTEIIVVDNDSSDESVNLIKKNYPEVILIESKENLGFARGNNLAVENSKGKYILLLNNDTILLNNLSDSIDILEHDKEIGVLGVKMLDGELNYNKSVGIFPKLLNLMFFSRLFCNGGEFLKGNFSKELIEVDWIQGSFLLIDKSLYLNVGGLDADYFMYVEDVDFCKKIERLKKKRVYYTAQSYIHYGGFNSTRKKQLIEGYIIYVKKHFNSLKPLALLFLNLKKKVLN